MTHFEQLREKHKKKEAFWMTHEGFAFRWHPDEGVHRKDAGEEEQLILHSNNLYQEAMSYGRCITEDQYNNF